MGARRVLVVEDQDLIRLILVEGLTDAGIEVLEASDGASALKLMQEAAGFDLLLTDIQMPGEVDGNEVGAFAKSLNAGLPVIYASGRPEMLRNTLSACDRFLSKPYGMTEVVSLVEHLLALHSPFDPSAEITPPEQGRR